MSDINQFTFTGRLTKDAEVRTLESGKTLLVANVAINTGYGNNKKTTYIKMQQWGASGANIASYLTKGNLIGASGQLSLNKWVGKDGVERQDLVVDVFSVQLLGPKPATVTAPSSTEDNSEPEDVTF